MKTLIVYYSMSGNCEETAAKIAAVSGADTLRIVPVTAYPDKGLKKFLWGGKSAVMGETPALEPYDTDLDAYDRVVIGFPVWASRPAPPIKSFIGQHKDELRSKRISVFACMAGSGAEKAIERLKEMIGTEELEAQMILTDPKGKDISDDIAEFCARIGGSAV